MYVCIYIKQRMQLYEKNVIGKIPREDYDEVKKYYHQKACISIFTPQIEKSSVTILVVDFMDTHIPFARMGD